MALDSGKRFGPYEVIAQLGSSEHGDVYKATDTRLNRAVTLRILPEHLSGEPRLRDRFEQGARALASLNHPHICTLHDIGHDSGAAFLIMEYVEGETLAKRLERGPLPLDEVLKLGIALADALDKAHRAGIVHRDLKPANVMLSPDGPKLLNFGIAELIQEDPGSIATRISTIAPGTIQGSVEYLAPEQLEGKPADTRSDVWALGVLLYEAITGKKAFEGKSRAVLVAAIHTTDPDPLTKVRPGVPSAFARVVQRCLAKNPDERWQSAHGVLLQLQWIAGGAGAATDPKALAAQRRRDRLMLVSLGIAAFLVASMATATALYFRGPGEPDAFHLRIPVTGLNSDNIAVSPDGKSIAMLVRPDTAGAALLYVRPVGAITFLKLAGTEDAAQPFWSPDSRYIAYVAGGKLKAVAATGGAPKQLADVSDFMGGSWSSGNVIVFGSSKGLFRVSGEGGHPEPLTAVEAPEAGHFWPWFLPDGNHFLYLAWSGEAGNRAIYAGALDSKDRTKLMTAESNPIYADPGYVLFHRNATLFAQKFRAKSLALSGEPIHVADDLAFNPANGRGDFDVSQNGTVIFFQGAATAAQGRGGRGGIQNARFAWVDRTGNEGDSVGERGQYGDMSLSPDQKQLAVTRQDAGAPGADIWVIDWQTAGKATRLTTDPADDINPVWTADGKRIAFTTYRKGNADIYIVSADGVGGETPLLESAGDELVEDFSRDGKYMAYLAGQNGFEDIYAAEISPDGKLQKGFPVVEGRFHKNEPQFSYDGKWLAYTSDKSGTYEVYVTSFPAHDQELKVSANDGGGQPRWRRDGKELYYRIANRLMAVDITPGAKLTSGIPHALFNTLIGAAAVDPTRHQMAAASDGQRFVLRVLPRGSGNRVGRGVPGAPATVQAVDTTARGQTAPAIGPLTTGLHVIRNWTAELEKVTP